VNALHESVNETEAESSFRKGELKFQAKGKKMKGEFVLVRLKDDPKNWLLIKHKHAGNLKTTSANRSRASKPGNGKKAPLPDFVSPMLATLTKIPFDDPDWVFEIKWDGFRAVAHTGKEKKLYSRNGLDFSTKFPGILNGLDKIKKSCILDGEIVLFNKKGLPDFQKLQHFETNRNYPLVYYVFDILFSGGKEMVGVPLHERKKLLQSILPANDQIRYCDHVDEKGIAFFDIAKRRGLEGVIAKKKDSLYYPGIRSREWLKIKNVLGTEAVIVGYTEPKGGRLYFGSVILATKKGKGWIYRGHAGTGFNAGRLKELKTKMDKLVTRDSPFDKKVSVNGKVTWIKPKLVADIAYTEITRDNIFRHPVFLHLREDKKLKDLNEE
jgi:bifunctional non-homologous end joining protein LigD